MFCFCFHFHSREEGGDLLYQSSNWIKENSTLCACPAWQARELESSHHLRGLQRKQIFSGEPGSVEQVVEKMLGLWWRLNMGQCRWKFSGVGEGLEMESEQGGWEPCGIWDFRAWGMTWVSWLDFCGTWRIQAKRASLPVRLVHLRAWSNWSFEIFNNLAFFSCCFPFLIYRSWPSTLGQFLFIFGCRKSLLTSLVLL